VTPSRSAAVGREVDAEIAATLFGWRWMTYPAPCNPQRWLTGIFPPDAPNRVATPNGYDRVWQPSTSTAERFSNWDEPVWWDDGEIKRGLPKFSTDIAAAMQVVEAMRERGYGFSVEWSKEHTTGHVCFSLWTPNFEGLGCEYGEFANTQDLPAAICRCALAALHPADGQPDAAAESLDAL
jgi:hypothetical protein